MKAETASTVAGIVWPLSVQRTRPSSSRSKRSPSGARSAPSASSAAMTPADRDPTDAPRGPPTEPGGRRICRAKRTRDGNAGRALRRRVSSSVAPQARPHPPSFRSHPRSPGAGGERRGRERLARGARARKRASLARARFAAIYARAASAPRAGEGGGGARVDQTVDRYDPRAAAFAPRDHGSGAPHASNSAPPLSPPSSSPARDAAEDGDRGPAFARPGAEHASNARERPPAESRGAGSERAAHALSQARRPRSRAGARGAGACPAPVAAPDDGGPPLSPSVSASFHRSDRSDRLTVSNPICRRARGTSSGLHSSCAPLRPRTRPSWRRSPR